MKRKLLPLALAILTGAAPAAVFACGCAVGGCGVEAPVPVGGSQCHGAGGETGSPKGHSRECCGQCLTGPAAFLLKKSSGEFLNRKADFIPASDAPGNAAIPSEQLFLPGMLRIPSPGFFTGKVLNASLTFRGPPAG